MINEPIISNKAQTDEKRSFVFPDPVILASIFHEYYEELAPLYKWKTNTSTAVDFHDLPLENKHLMTHVCCNVISFLKRFDKNIDNLENKI